jgi:CheY-like chemotaxis protein
MSSRTTPVVLVADDEPSMLALVARHVKTLGYEVLEASDGQNAWSHAARQLPDLVVLDVMMPGMSGWEVCRRIRENVALAHTGVIMLTGIGQSLNELTSPLYGADAYIDKPFEFKELDDKIREVLTKRGHAVVELPPPSVDPGELEAGSEEPDSAVPSPDASPAPPPAPAAAAKPGPRGRAAPSRGPSVGGLDDEDESFFSAVTLRPPPPANWTPPPAGAPAAKAGAAKRTAKARAGKRKPATKASRPAAHRSASAKAKTKVESKTMKKTTTKKTAAKKPAAKKAPAKKPAAKKPAAKKGAKKAAVKAVAKPADMTVGSKMGGCRSRCK